MGIFDFWRKEKKTVTDQASQEKTGICTYYQNGFCVAGGQKNSCSANPHNNASCFVYKFHSTGDISTLY